ncbi:MAG: ISNCY family transposase [Spirochaetaceae bacterium]|jgi:transposase|nr:ISNCY family transposase [Spirochaetaceae bacterium]
MAGKIPMGKKELLRGKLMAMVEEGKMTLKEAGKRLGISYRQVKRIKASYKKNGDAGLVHGSSGKKSNRQISDEIREKVIKTYQGRYSDFGPTFAAEKLLEVEGVKISAETLRKWLLKEGLWERQRKASGHRSRRERKKCFGDLIQIDGSHHRWFEERGVKCCLMNMVDDATGITFSILFDEETIEAAMGVLRGWIERYGIPKALYCDHKNCYIIDREATEDELRRGITKPKTHFQIACEKLGIEVIPAGSPQAKGRVERNHGVYQDRFVKELRLAGISTIAAANRFLQDDYLPKINAKFATAPKEAVDSHVPLMGIELGEIFVYQYDRVVANDYVIRFETRQFQILNTNKERPRPKDRVLIHKKVDGEIKILWKNKPLKIREIIVEEVGNPEPLTA